MNKDWTIKKRAPKKFLEKFPEFSQLMLQLLWNRGLKHREKIDEFFNPDYEKNLHDPFLLKGLKKSIKRIEGAARRNEKVVIFADYDADGVCSATLMVEVLALYDLKPYVYIPDRQTEGYGLNFEAINEFSKRGYELIITVDCGITDIEEVRLAKQLKIDVLIFDHHEVLKKVPPALAIVNPKQKKCRYPFKNLSAAGVVFKLVQAVSEIKKMPKSWEKWLLDLVAISTVTDSMPLFGENRTLVKYGLIVLSQTKRKGLAALMSQARINPSYDAEKMETNLSTVTLGFMIGPRLNAASRIDRGSLAYELLNAKTEEEAQAAAKKLEAKNLERQKIVSVTLKEARGKILDTLDGKKVIFVGNKNWSNGIVGLIAQKLSEEFNRPAFVYRELNDRCVGSVRSLPGFNVVKAMAKCKDLLMEFGGHPEAAGFTVLNENLPGFKQVIEKIAKKELSQGELARSIYIDAEMDENDLSWKTFDEVRKFAPFENNNHIAETCNNLPLFLIKKAKIKSIRSVGSNGNHSKMSIGIKDKQFTAIGFGLANDCANIKTGDKVDIVFEMISNEWNDTKELQLRIVDLKKV